MEDEIVPLPKKAPYWFKILFAFMLIGAGIGVWNVLFTENVIDIVESQLEAIRENKITEAYYTYMSQDFQRTTSLAGFKEFIRTHPPLENYSSFLFEKRVIEDQTTTIDGILIGVDKKEYPVQFKLIKEESGWKVMSINILQPLQLEKSLTQPSAS